jgi:Pilin (bacterial filament)
MSGCGIATIIGAAVVVLGLFLGGIYALNAVRDAQQAQAAATRAKISDGMDGLERLKATIDDYVLRHRACPSNSSLKMPSDATYDFGADGELPASLRVGAFSNGHCVIELRFISLEPRVEGTLVLEATESGWTCSGGTLDPKLRPAQCRSSKHSP